MSDEPIDAERQEAYAPFIMEISEVRYSLREMMKEVEAERKHSVLGRELVDKTEIRKMFAKRKRKIKKSQ